MTGETAGRGGAETATASDVPFHPRVAAASLSGQSDAAWARAAAPYVGCAFLGGIALDGPTRDAARAMVARDRTEFLPADPLAFVDDQLAALADAPVRPAFNVRAARPDPIRDAAAVCRDRGAILEINAHCRQDEMCGAGAGEALLADADRLCEYVRAAADAGAAVSVKVRTEVAGVDLPSLAARVADAGANVVHVDAMDSERVVGEVVEAVTACDSTDATGDADAFVVANNGVRDGPTVREYLDLGADAVSVGRPSDDPRVLRRVAAAVGEWFDADGDRDGDEDGERKPGDGQDGDGDGTGSRAARAGGPDA